MLGEGFINLTSVSTMQALISPCHKYFMPDLEKARNINIPAKILLHWLQNVCKFRSPT